MPLYNPVSGGTGTNPSYVLLQYVVAAGTNGGSATTGAWTTRPINTEVIDVDNICTLAANVITLSAGTYDMDGWSAHFLGQQSQIRLRNTTAGTTLRLGPSTFLTSTAPGQEDLLPIAGRFTVAAAQNLELQYNVVANSVGNGLGVARNQGENETYAQLEFWKVA